MLLAYQDCLVDAAHVVVSDPQCARDCICALERHRAAIHHLPLDIAEQERRVVTGVDICHHHKRIGIIKQG